MLKPFIAAAGAAVALGAIPVVIATPAQACNPVPIPALGINADCALAAAQAGDCLLTGICAPGTAATPGTRGGGLPTIPAFTPPQSLPPMNLPPNPVQVPLPPEPPQNFQQGQQCSNDPAFYASHSLSCPTMPGFTGPPPGMAPGQPNDPGVVGP
jgi:hypothetical protein